MSTSERPSENGGALWALEAPWEPNGGKTPASRKQDRTVRKAEYAFESGWHHGETFVPGTALVGRVLRTGSFLQREGPGTGQREHHRQPTARMRANVQHRRGGAAAPIARHENPGTGRRGRELPSSTGAAKPPPQSATREPRHWVARRSRRPNSAIRLPRHWAERRNRAWN